MKTSLQKYFALAVVSALVTTVFSCQPQPKDDGITVDLSKKKLKPEQASKMSKLFVKDIKALLKAQDSLEYYKKLLNQTKQEADGSENPQSAMATKVKLNLSASSWYSLDELQTYINESKRKADSFGYTLEGFRMYTGVYPDNDEFGDKAYYLTTFIAPTGKKNVSQGSIVTLPFYDGSGDIEGIDPLDYGGEGRPPDATYPQEN